MNDTLKTFSTAKNKMKFGEHGALVVKLNGKLNQDWY